MKAIELSEKDRARVGVAWVQGYTGFRRDGRGRLVANYRSERLRKVPDPIDDEVDACCLRVWLNHHHYRVMTETTTSYAVCEVGHLSRAIRTTFEAGTGGVIDTDAMERIAVVKAVLLMMPEGTLESLEVAP